MARMAIDNACQTLATTTRDLAMSAAQDMFDAIVAIVKFRSGNVCRDFPYATGIWDLL